MSRVRRFSSMVKLERWKMLDQAVTELAKLQRAQNAGALRLSRAPFTGRLRDELKKLTPSQLTALGRLLSI